MFKLTGVYKPKQIEKQVEKQEVKVRDSYKKSAAPTINAKVQYIDNDFYAVTESGNKYKLNKLSKSTENRKIIYLNIYTYPKLKPAKIIRDRDNLRALGSYYIPFKTGLNIKGRIKPNDEFEITNIEH